MQINFELNGELSPQGRYFRAPAASEALRRAYDSRMALEAWHRGDLEHTSKHGTFGWTGVRFYANAKIPTREIN